MHTFWGNARKYEESAAGISVSKKAPQVFAIQEKKSIKGEIYSFQIHLMTYLQDTLLPNETVILETKTSMRLLTEHILNCLIVFGIGVYFINHPELGMPEFLIAFIMT